MLRSESNIESAYKYVEDKIKAHTTVWSTEEQKSFGAAFKKVLVMSIYHLLYSLV